MGKSNNIILYKINGRLYLGCLESNGNSTPRAIYVTKSNNIA